MHDGKSSSGKMETGGSALSMDALCLKGDKFFKDAFAGQEETGAFSHKQRIKTQIYAKNAHSNATQDNPDKNQSSGFWAALAGSANVIGRFFAFMREPDWPAVLTYTRSVLVQDWGRGNGIVWYALCHMAGVLVYFALPAEPVGVLSGLAPILLSFMVFRRCRAGGAMVGLAALLFFSLGFFLADLRVEYARGVPLDHPVSRKVEGVVAGIKHSGQGGYSVVFKDVEVLGKAGKTALGYKIRVNLKGVKIAPVLGSRVQVRVRLLPPGGAVRPGGYDFARTAFFKGIGAVGYGLSQPVVVSDATGLGVWRELDNIRQRIALRIRRVLNNSPESAFAVALLVGKRDYLGQGDKEALRNAGLAHVLAISGMHMGLVTSLVFLGVRLVLSFSQSVVLRGTLYLYASGGALVGATVYLGLSGGSVATQRAYMMVLLVLCAGLLGRRAFNHRGLAIACLVVLSVRPEEVLAPGFQMSFMAVLALLSFYSPGQGWLLRGGETEKRKTVFFLFGMFGRSIYLILKWIFACAITSMVAGAATAPFAAMHFEQVAPYGVLGNILAMPLVSFVVMPLGLLSLLSIPLGADAIFLHGMEVGLALVLQVAYWVSGLSEGLTSLGAAGAGGYMLAVLGIVMVCVLPAWLKALSGPVLAAGFLVFFLDKPPDVIVADGGKHIAFYDQQGAFRVTSSRMSFAADSLLRAGGVASSRFREHRARAQDRACDAQGCVLKLFPKGVGERGRINPAPLHLAVPKSQEGLEADCRFAAILVTQSQAPGNCSAQLIIDQQMLDTYGAAYLWLSREAGVGERIKKVRWAYNAQRRPWNPQISKEGNELIAAEERNHLALNAHAARPEDASFVGGVGRFQRD